MSGEILNVHHCKIQSKNDQGNLSEMYFRNCCVGIHQNVMSEQDYRFNAEGIGEMIGNGTDHGIRIETLSSRTIKQSCQLFDRDSMWDDPLAFEL
jgi:hypothetical protein